MQQIVWDTELENVGLPSNMYFGTGSEFGDIIYRLQHETDGIRWCVFSVNGMYFVIQQSINKNDEWNEDWTRQMDKDLNEAKGYAEKEYLNHYNF